MKLHIARNKHNVLRKTMSLFALLLSWLPFAGDDDAGMMAPQDWDAVWPSETPEGWEDEDAPNAELFTDPDLFEDGEMLEGVFDPDDESIELDSALTRRLNRDATFYSEEEISSDETVVVFPEVNYFDEQPSTDPQPAVAEDGAWSWEIAHTGLDSFNPADGFAVGDATEWLIGP